jgi:hypothetical protein
MLKKIEIQHSAIKYIKDELGFAGGFGRVVAENLDLDQGCVYVYLPEILQPYIEEFPHSILGIFQEIDSADINAEAVIDEIKTAPKNLVFQYLQKNTKGCAIFETFYLAKDTISNQNKFKPHIVFNNAVYWFLTQDKANREMISQCFKTRKKYPSIIGLSTCPISWKHNIFGKEVQNAAIQLLVKKLDYLLVGSYDEETFLIWER